MSKIFTFLSCFLLSHVLLAQRGGLGGAGAATIKNGMIIFLVILVVAGIGITIFMMKNFKDK